MRATDHRSIAGFTLIELIVAVFITAIVFAIGFGGINQAVKNRDTLQANQARVSAVQLALRLLQQDVAQVTPRPVRDVVGSGWKAALEGDGSSTSTNRMLFELTRAGWANPAGIQRTGLQRVRWMFEDGKLRREHWRVLDATQAEEPVKREVLDRVKSVKVRFMDDARQWVTAWPGVVLVPGAGTSAFRRLPRAVEVTLELDDFGEIVRTIEVAP